MTKESEQLLAALQAALTYERQVSQARASALRSLRDAYEELAAAGDFDAASDEIRQRVHEVLYHAKPE
jgi:predicted glycosyltransferase